MKSTVVFLCLVVAAGILAGCNDSGPSYPIGDGGWQLVVSTGRIPDNIDEYPVFVSIEAQAFDLTAGAQPADGTILVFSASDGVFANGLPDIELGMVEGRADADLQIDHPGRYEVMVDFPEQDCSAVTTFDVGL